eukprot:CAMPEP_0197549970 /NCGR_PEP_ID=MMETSP1320-20131121/3718_1 /TAXON_ID=91990 /ORGANISM="Bolidomonas sp., Strain RCC2347" /LENGTH=92 /DNA_ID=CAMNT_0043110273 /DNA_START=220 /DNA_END=494 /DNA_ORIENTATION=+
MSLNMSLKASVSDLKAFAQSLTAATTNMAKALVNEPHKPFVSTMSLPGLKCDASSCSSTTNTVTITTSTPLLTLLLLLLLAHYVYLLACHRR